MSRRNTGLTVRAPAKINLHLGVGGVRPDGMHPLLTVYQAVSLYDDLAAAPAEAWRLGLTVDDHVAAHEVPLAGDNIVDRAADLLAAHHGLARADHGAAVHITKAIPVAGGMAGGSADAAAALVALDRLWGLETCDDDLLAIAAELGSDVPFALLGGTAVGTGRGEIVTPVADHGSWWWVLALSARGMSTPAVYRHFDELHPDASPEPPPADALLAALDSGDPARLAATLHNDLQAPAFDLRPDLADRIARGEAEGALRGLVSGSGPTCVFLCGSGEHARAVAAALRVPDPATGAEPVVLVAHGPVAGAHVVEGLAAHG
ncbi:4-(cytidine 5'-diphospho)-2-C-methyl-D-erythritol kinase [Nocardioides panaciterrulae]|uniref:4-diphosphocytidyl-2-C-methyl-D-erythritol kinase n=1 Tax=Nocardioides panaciterrulae TaxID=661492 RepID=A0A7Y9E8Y4_9ACTN|nr:4-diphosphocytidyl-2-C-methyl-D-erythritol kinase [Nocardioides panaciterrulae]